MAEYSTHFEPDEIVFLQDGERVGSIAFSHTGKVSLTGWADAHGHLLYVAMDYAKSRIQFESQVQADMQQRLKSKVSTALFCKAEA